MKAIKLIFSAALLAAALLVVAGCKHRAAQAGGLDAVFELESVNGKTLPAEVHHQGKKLTVVSGRMTFLPESESRSETVFRPESGKEVRRAVSAVYTERQGKLEMQWRGAGRTVGIIEGDTFTMNNEGMIFRYRKAEVK